MQKRFKPGFLILAFAAPLVGIFGGSEIALWFHSIRVYYWIVGLTVILGFVGAVKGGTGWWRLIPITLYCGLAYPVIVLGLVWAGCAFYGDCL
jgi:hypothetical protein